ncbi:MAG: putative lipoprotein [Myxococcales bacterium]|nr:putative lipoprotein [Myxococcales bacterium]
MNRALATVAVACVAGTLAGCSSDLPAASFIDKLRVLAVRAEPPEVAPGEWTALDLLAVEPRVQQLDGGAARPLSAVWLACTLPSGTLTVSPCGVGGGLGTSGSTTLAPPSCDDAPGAPLCVISTNLKTAYLANPGLLGDAASAELLITVAVADTDAGAIGCLLDIANNEGRPTDPDHCVVALKRLQMSAPDRRTSAPNHNPTLATFTAASPAGNYTADLLDGNGVFTLAAGKDLASWEIAANRAADAAERKADGTYEALTVSWFTSAGHLDGGRSLYLPPGCNDPAACAAELPEEGASTTWFAPTPAEAATTTEAGGEIDFYAVIRDDRGGVGWRAGTLRPTP